MTNVYLPLLLSVFVVVATIVVAVIVVAISIVALVTIDTLTFSLVPQMIAIYPQSPRPMASASTSTSTSTDTTAWVVRDYPPSLGSPMDSSSCPGRQAVMVMGNMCTKGRRGGEN